MLSSGMPTLTAPVALEHVKMQMFNFRLLSVTHEFPVFQKECLPFELFGPFSFRHQISGCFTVNVLTFNFIQNFNSEHFQCRMESTSPVCH